MRYHYRHPNTFSMRDCDRFPVIEQRNTFLRIAIFFWRAGRRPTALRTLPHLVASIPQLRSIVQGRHESNCIALVEARFSWSLGSFANTAQSTKTVSVLQGKKTKSTAGLAI